MISSLLLIQFVFSLHAASEAPPTTQSILDLLFANSNIKLPKDAAKGCAGAFDSPRKTIGSYLAFLISTQIDTQPAGEIQPTVKCERAKKKNSPWTCEFTMSSKSTEEPWHYGLHFTYPDKGKKLDPVSLSCPGAG